MTQARYAGFWVRLLADVIDSGVLFGVAYLLELAVLGAIHWGGYLSGGGQMESVGAAKDLLTPLGLQVLSASVYLCCVFPYYVWGHYRFGTTLGKKLFDIRVVQTHEYGALTLQQSVIRCLGYAASSVTLGAGYLMAAIHPRKQALHDLLAGTVSIRVGSARGAGVLPGQG